MSTAPDPDEDLVVFLKASSVPNKLKNEALQCILGLSATDKGVEHILQHEKYLPALCSIAGNEDYDKELHGSAYNCLINISSQEMGCKLLTSLSEPPFLEWIFRCLGNFNYPFIPLQCQLLSNISRYPASCKILSEYFSTSFDSFKKIIEMFSSANKQVREKYDHLASVFCNLTQEEAGRRLFLDRRKPYIEYLMPYTTYMDSEVRRIGIIGTLRNCCFDTDHHKWLLEDMNILANLLFPLVGPEIFDDDEMETLPLELQYLGEEKQREPNSVIRIMLIEGITKLCATKEARDIVKSKGTYYIMRELHKWEKDHPVVVACENLVDILIGDEPEPKMENLNEIYIPPDLVKQFEEIDIELQKL